VREPSVVDVHSGRFPGEVAVGGWQGALTCGGARGCSGESSLGAVEKATVEAEKHGDRSEKLSALVAEARGMIEQAKTEQAERARAASAEAAAAAAVKAAERQQMEEEVAALALTVQSDALRLQSEALRLRQMQAQLGVPPAAPALHPDDAEDQCVLCLDAPKDHIIIPCGHQCVCEACAEKLKARNPLCPFCRAPINATHKVFVV
jgi:hypothetical protein